jgi:hypothetical protein
METIKSGYTRISDILSQWDKFGHIDPAMLSNKAGIGIRVHEAIDAHHKGIYYPLQANEEGYFNSFLEWEKKVSFDIVKNEERYYCQSLMITGQVDLVAQFPGEAKPLLIDYKTSASSSREMWSLQAAFYHKLCEINGLDLSDRMIFLQLDKKGSQPTVHEYTYSDKLWRVCESCLITYRYLKEWIEKRKNEYKS